MEEESLNVINALSLELLIAILSNCSGESTATKKV